MKIKSKRKLLISILAVVLVMIFGVGIYSYTVYDNAKNTINEKMYNPVESIDLEVVKKKVKEEKPLNILLLGVDQRGDDPGRSDALMVLSLNPKENSAKLVSIPRDTRTEIIGHGTSDKINHAYAFGGPEMSIATVENLLDVELDYYVRMNMEGLSDMVDAVGGITLNNSLDWYDEGYYKKGYHYAKGELNLNGPQTMGYVRMRYLDPRGDFGRTERQRQVIQGVLDKGASIGSVTKINEMIDVLGNNMSTNMDFTAMKDLMFNYKDTRKNFSTYQLQGTGTKIDGVYYMTVSDEEIQKVHNMLLKKS
ncbi:LCP family glycopolymer transferase [Aquibacillus kalidii]|uniref:LCP family glycopolymer transferase n=1 Tax=Aquibacillus kalidii TaxID=2762597 RepID=UPI0016442944|nr:LCP family protein [Aquibacillus kalidii]